MPSRSGSFTAGTQSGTSHEQASLFPRLRCLATECPPGTAERHNGRCRIHTDPPSEKASLISELRSPEPGFVSSPHARVGATATAEPGSVTDFGFAIRGRFAFLNTTGASRLAPSVANSDSLVTIATRNGRIAVNKAGGCADNDCRVELHLSKPSHINSRSLTRRAGPAAPAHE